MSDAAVTRINHELRILEALVDCAHELSVAVADAAEAETDATRRLQMFDAFQRGFLAVRMGIRLSMTLRAGTTTIARPAAPAPAREKSETERRETERRDEPGLERDRDRDYEPVSLPKFLSTLGVVASDAARLGGLPTNIRADLLPTLDTLLARARDLAPPPAAAAVALLARPKAAPRMALLGTTSAISGSPLAFHGRPRPPPYRST